MQTKINHHPTTTTPNTLTMTMILTNSFTLPTISPKIIILILVLLTPILIRKITIKSHSTAIVDKRKNGEVLPLSGDGVADNRDMAAARVSEEAENILDKQSLQNPWPH